MDIDWEKLEREEAAWIAGNACPCGQRKEAGEAMCEPCVQLEQAEAGRDYEEEERQEALLRCLPDGDYTASEMAEYLS